MTLPVARPAINTLCAFQHVRLDLAYYWKNLFEDISSFGVSACRRDQRAHTGEGELVREERAGRTPAFEPSVRRRKRNETDIRERLVTTKTTASALGDPPSCTVGAAKQLVKKAQPKN